MGIEITKLRKRFNEGTTAECEVLKGISLTIGEGELVAIKGKSGAGKSTLLHILGGLDQMSEGTYRLDGVELNGLTNKKLAELRNQKFGFILQDFGLINDDTVLHNIILPMMFGKTKLSQMEPIARKYMKQFGIEQLEKQEVATLSGGEKQRVAIARALVNNPQYILADEPTGSLDSVNTQILMEQLVKLNESGKTVIIITHDDMVAAQCKRVIQIRDGVIVKG